MRAGTIVVRFVEQAAEGGPHPQHGEVVPRDPVGDAGRCLSGVEEAGLCSPGAREATEGRLLMLQPTEDRITEGRTARFIGGRAAL